MTQSKLQMHLPGAHELIGTQSFSEPMVNTYYRMHSPEISVNLQRISPKENCNFRGLSELIPLPYKKIVML